MIKILLVEDDLSLSNSIFDFLDDFAVIISTGVDTDFSRNSFRTWKPSFSGNIRSSRIRSYTPLSASYKPSSPSNTCITSAKSSKKSKMELDKLKLY